MRLSDAHGHPQVPPQRVRILPPQSRRSEIVASEKNYAAGLAYLQAHPATGATQFTTDITSGLFKRLADRKHTTSAAAIRICH
jgi:hypothetical protein